MQVFIPSQSGANRVQGNLTVTGSATIGDNETVAGSLTVNGNELVKGNLVVNGTITGGGGGGTTVTTTTLNNNTLPASLTSLAVSGNATIAGSVITNTVQSPSGSPFVTTLLGGTTGISEINAFGSLQIQAYSNVGSSTPATLVLQPNGPGLSVGGGITVVGGGVTATSLNSSGTLTVGSSVITGSGSATAIAMPASSGTLALAPSSGTTVTTTTLNNNTLPASVTTFAVSGGSTVTGGETVDSIVLSSSSSTAGISSQNSGGIFFDAIGLNPHFKTTAGNSNHWAIVSTGGSTVLNIGNNTATGGSTISTFNNTLDSGTTVGNASIKGSLTTGSLVSTGTASFSAAGVSVDASANLFVKGTIVSENSAGTAINYLGSTTGTTNFTDGASNDTIIQNRQNLAMLLGFGTGSQQSSLKLTYPYTVSTLNVTLDDGSSNFTINGTTPTMNLNGSTSNMLLYNANGIAGPSVSTRSAGTKVVLNPGLTASTVDYALGVGTNNLWTSVPSSTQSFDWYANTVPIMTLSGTGVLEANVVAINGSMQNPSGNTINMPATAGTLALAMNYFVGFSSALTAGRADTWTTISSSPGITYTSAQQTFNLPNGSYVANYTFTLSTPAATSLLIGAHINSPGSALDSSGYAYNSTVSNQVIVSSGQTVFSVTGGTGGIYLFTGTSYSTAAVTLHITQVA